MPDAVCDYNDCGMLNDRPCFSRIDGAYFLWWELPGEAWILSEVLGVKGANYWHRAFPDIVGLYVPEGTYTGDATVAVGTHLL